MQRIQRTDQGEIFDGDTIVLHHTHTWIQKHFSIVTEILSEFPLLKCYPNVL